MRLELRRAVTAHYAVGSQPKRFNDSVGEARSLVGDDAPGDVAALEFMQEFWHAGEQARVDANALGVALQERVAQARIIRVAGREAEADAQQPARAHRRVRGHGFAPEPFRPAPG